MDHEMDTKYLALWVSREDLGDPIQIPTMEDLLNRMGITKPMGWGAF